MEFIQNKINQIKKLLQEKGLYDVRVLALVGVGVIAISVFWNGANIVQQNYELAQKVEAIEQENEILRLENQNKELRNEYLATDEFAEITARRIHGKASPGERVYIVPKDVALDALSEDAEEDEGQLTQHEKPAWQKNLESWVNIYFGS